MSNTEKVEVHALTPTEQMILHHHLSGFGVDFALTEGQAPIDVLTPLAALFDGPATVTITRTVQS